MGTWWSCGCHCPLQGGCTRWPLRALPTHMILWFYEFMQCPCSVQRGIPRCACISLSLCRWDIPGTDCVLTQPWWLGSEIKCRTLLNQIPVLTWAKPLTSPSLLPCASHHCISHWSLQPFPHLLSTIISTKACHATYYTWPCPGNSPAGTQMGQSLVAHQIFELMFSVSKSKWAFFSSLGHLVFSLVVWLLCTAPSPLLYTHHWRL